MNASAAHLVHQQQGYDAYLAEGASLLSRICDRAHLAHFGGRLLMVAEVSPALADALGNWGAELADLEPEDAL